MEFNELLKSTKLELKKGSELFNLYHSTLESVAKETLVDAGFATDVQQVLSVKIADKFLQLLSVDYVEPSEPEIQTAEDVAADYQKHLEETAKEDEETFEHTVTQQDLDLNPELVSADVKVGDIILIPKHSDVPEEDVQLELKRLSEHNNNLGGNTE